MAALENCCPRASLRGDVGIAPYTFQEIHLKHQEHQKKVASEPLHRLTAVPLVLSGPLCPAGISPPRGESPLSGEADVQTCKRRMK